MFEVGFWELALIFALGLVVLGPEKLPKVAAQLGRYVGNARRMARTLTTQIRDEIEAEERRIMASENRPHSTPPVTPEAAYSRPGAEDLIPKDPEPDARAAAADPADGTPPGPGSS
ncbi:MAG: Sec-independent protein translocase protein TatB [Gammaproteobacteria bacterium]